MTRRQADNHRASIRVAKLLERLNKNAMGELKNPQGEPYTLSPTEVKSIQVLLDKAMPNLQAIDQTVRDERPTLTPEELEQELGKLIRAMPESQLNRLRAGEPDLKVIEGEVIG